MTKPTFTATFKREAAELITLKNYSYTEACEARGCSGQQKPDNFIGDLTLRD